MQAGQNVKSFKQSRALVRAPATDAQGRQLCEPRAKPSGQPPGNLAIGQYVSYAYSHLTAEWDKPRLPMRASRAFLFGVRDTKGSAVVTGAWERPRGKQSGTGYRRRQGDFRCPHQHTAEQGKMQQSEPEARHPETGGGHRWLSLTGPKLEAGMKIRIVVINQVLFVCTFSLSVIWCKS